MSNLSTGASLLDLPHTESETTIASQKVTDDENVHTCLDLLSDMANYEIISG